MNKSQSQFDYRLMFSMYQTGSGAGIRWGTSREAPIHSVLRLRRLPVTELGMEGGVLGWQLAAGDTLGYPLVLCLSPVLGLSSQAARPDDLDLVRHHNNNLEGLEMTEVYLNLSALWI